MFLTRHACRILTRTSASSNDATPVGRKAAPPLPSKVEADGEREKKMALYAELFELDVSGDVRRHAAKQVRCAGGTPLVSTTPLNVCGKICFPDELNNLLHQIATGKKPFFVARREKVALYDRLFSSGTVRSDKLVEGVERVRSGRAKSLVEVEGVEIESSFRPRLGAVEW
jgi:hypothetical protein